MEILATIGVLALFGWGASQMSKIAKKENEMKREVFEQNKAERQAQNKFEEVLVKLEEEYGSETGAPFVETAIDYENREVTFNGHPIGGLQDARALVKDAEKQAMKALERDTRVPELKPVVIGGFIHNFSIGGQNLFQEQTVSAPMGDPLMVEKFWETAEDHVLDNMPKFLPHLNEGRTFYEAAMKVREKLVYAKSVKQVFADNAEKKRVLQETGEFQEYEFVDSPWSTFREVDLEIQARSKEFKMFSDRARQLGFEPQLIEVGKTYVKTIAAQKQKTSHPQRTAALRLGLILDCPLTFRVEAQCKDPKKWMIDIDGTKAIVALHLDDHQSDFYVKSFFPLDEEAYFEKNEWMDEYYQDNPDVSLEELVALGLHSNFEAKGE